MGKRLAYPILDADEAAALVPHNALVGIGGFTPAGAPKAVPRALAHRARALNTAGHNFQIRMISGASTGPACDDALAAAHAISWRAPYASSAALRKAANAGEVDFIDMHLSHVSQVVLEEFLGPVDLAIIEATEITPDGRVYLTTGIGNAPTFLQCANKVIIELNSRHSGRLREITDIVVLAAPPDREPIPINDPLDKIGKRYAHVDPSKVLGVVLNDEPDGVGGFEPPNDVSEKIAENVARFLVDELRAGRIPPEFLPLQSGVGNVCNAVLAGLAAAEDLPKFKVYTEVLQDAMLDLVANGHVTGASTCSLTLTDEKLSFLYDNFDDFIERLVLRPQEISNNPGVARRLGVIATNTAIEADIYGHVNSTHLFGTQLMNGIGGSGDFQRNAYLSIFMCPSVAKGGRISTIVPMCSHVDHSEHSVQVIVTEQGLADLRGLAPEKRARRIINCCAHPAYRDYLHRYIDTSPPGHIRHNLRTAFELHNNYTESGSMLPDVFPPAAPAAGRASTNGHVAPRIVGSTK